MDGERMDEQEKLILELKKLAFGEASDASGAALKSAGKLRALELLGKVYGVFDGPAGNTGGVTVVEDV